MWLFVLFLAIPLIEIALFVQIGGIIGLWWTLAIVVFTAILGTSMIRTQGAMAMVNLRSSFNDMRDPTEPLAHGAMILIAGMLLLTPGFFTDTVGFLLLIPPVRQAVYGYVRSRVTVQGFSTTGPAQQPRQSDLKSDGTVLEGEYTEVENTDEPPRRGDSGWTKH
ncbi:MAG: FxsA family protein [Marinosulfonomonas sp.]